MRIQSCVVNTHAELPLPARKSGLQASMDTRLAGIFGRLDMETIERSYHAQDEFVYVREALPPDLVRELVDEYEASLSRRAHRSWIPNARKAGTIGWLDIQAHAPKMEAVYRSPVVVDVMRRLSQKDLVLKDDDDPHSAALYAYTKKGDGINYHYDTCGCELGASYALIFGLIDDSRSIFSADLFKRTKKAPVKHVDVKTPPGSMLIFCGDNVWHAATPVGPNEKRVVACLSYVTDGKQVRGFKRFTENVRDAVFYFGIPAVFQRNYRWRR
jgi:hypothetical protein